MASDIVTRELEEPIDVAEYLFQRLRQMGIKSIHGVPGKLIFIESFGTRYLVSQTLIGMSV